MDPCFFVSKKWCGIFTSNVSLTIVAYSTVLKTLLLIQPMAAVQQGLWFEKITVHGRLFSRNGPNHTLSAIGQFPFLMAPYSEDGVCQEATAREAAFQKKQR
jgi:hypothetical protein